MEAKCAFLNSRIKRLFVYENFRRHCNILAHELLKGGLLSMKSNRTRFLPQDKLTGSLNRPYRGVGPVRLTEMPSPMTLPEISPEQVVADILVCTLERVQRSSSPEVAAAAARYLSVFR